MQRADQTTYLDKVEIYPQQMSNDSQGNVYIPASPMNFVTHENRKMDTIVAFDGLVSPKGARTTSSQNQLTFADSLVDHSSKHRSEGGGEKQEPKKGKIGHREKVPDALVVEFNSVDFETLKRNPFVCLPKICEMGTSLQEREEERKKQEEGDTSIFAHQLECDFLKDFDFAKYIVLKNGRGRHCGRAKHF